MFEYYHLKCNSYATTPVHGILGRMGLPHFDYRDGEGLVVSHGQSRIR
jgi:hypothetical protein